MENKQEREITVGDVAAGLFKIGMYSIIGANLICGTLQTTLDICSGSTRREAEANAREMFPNSHYAFIAGRYITYGVHHAYKKLND